MMSFDETLARCLSDIEAERLTIEDCLRRYPEHAAALSPLLQTALALRELPALNPSPAFVAAAPARMQNLIAARQQPPALVAAPRRWRLVFVKLAAAVALAAIMLTGTAYAARDSLPDSPLYSVKRTVESVQVATARSDVKRSRVFVGQMDKRVAETVLLIRTGRLVRARETSAAYLRLLSSAETATQRIALDRPGGRPALQYMHLRLQAHHDALSRLQEQRPEVGRPWLRAALDDIERALARIDERLAP